jgi:hypothetical protein
MQLMLALLLRMIGISLTENFQADPRHIVRQADQVSGRSVIMFINSDWALPWSSGCPERLLTRVQPGRSLENPYPLYIHDMEGRPLLFRRLPRLPFRKPRPSERFILPLFHHFQHFSGKKTPFFFSFDSSVPALTSSVLTPPW